MQAVIRHADAVEIRIECDERGFELYLVLADGHERVFNVQAVAVDLLAAVEREIAPWHREGMAVLAAMRAGGAFECDPDESAGYDRDDPKHPDWHSVHADHYDARPGK